MGRAAWKLPDSWIWSCFNDVVIVAQNLVHPRTVQELPHIAPNHMESRTRRLLEYTTVQADKVISSKHRFYPGQVLYSKIRPYLRKAVAVDFDGVCSADVYPLTPTPAIVREYLLYWLVSDDFDAMAAEHQGRTLLPKINEQGLAATSIPVPSLEEQHRIVAKLDALTDHLVIVRQELERALELSSIMRDAALTKVATARTSVHRLGQVVTRIRTGPFGSAVHKRDYVAGGTPLINPMHIVSGQIRPSNSVTVNSRKAEELADFRLNIGEVVIGRRGEMGRCAVVTEAASGWLIGTGSMALTPSAAIDSTYLQLFLSSPPSRRALEANSVGSTMVNLNQGILLNLEIAVPDLPAQEKMVESVGATFAVADRLEAEAARARALLDPLEAAILAKAFRGELVPQDPNDEPARVLLERIRAERAAAPPSRRGRRSRAAGSQL